MFFIALVIGDVLGTARREWDSIGYRVYPYLRRSRRTQHKKRIAMTDFKLNFKKVPVYIRMHSFTQIIFTRKIIRFLIPIIFKILTDGVDS